MKEVLTADFQALFEASPTPLLVIAPPDWTIVAANDARLRVTGTTREEQIGRRLFDVSPDDPNDPNADGVRNLTASLQRVVATKSTHMMAVQRYALRGGDGRIVDRWWSPVNTPVLGPDGEITLIIHHVEDVTEVVRPRGDSDGRDALARTQQLVIDRLRASETAHRDAEERYHALFNAIDQGFCTIEVAFDEDDKPVDYRFLEISPSFERQTGIENGAGRWMREIAADQDQFWFDTYGGVALTGEPAHFESFSTPLSRWWSVYAFRISGERRIAVLFRDITDQKRAEAELRQSEARLAFLDRLGAETGSLAEADAVLAATTRLLGEHLNLSLCAYADMDEDQDGFTIRGDWAAPGSKSIVGHYSLADFGKLAVEHLSAGEPLVVSDNLKELAPEEAATFQSIGIAATICMPLVKEGRLTALMAIHDRVPRGWTDAELSLLREVTARSWAHVERVAAVAELRTSEAQFRLMADAVPQIVWITDRHGRMEFLNRRFVEYTGAPYGAYAPAEMAANFIHAEDGGKVVAAFEAALTTGEPFEIEHRIRSVAGEDRWFLARAEPYHDPGTGEIVRWFGASVDIHERKLAQEALAASRATLQAVYDNTPVGLIVAELPSGRLVESNRTLETIFRHPMHRTDSPDDYGIWESYDADGRRTAAPDYPLARTFATGEAAESTYHFVRGDGTRAWLRVQTAPIRNASGAMAGGVVAVTDVDEMMRNREALERLTTGLETQVAERTAELRLHRDMIQSNPAPILAFDRDYRVIAFNRAHAEEWQRVFGREARSEKCCPTNSQPIRARSFGP